MSYTDTVHVLHISLLHRLRVVIDKVLFCSEATVSDSDILIEGRDQPLFF